MPPRHPPTDKHHAAGERQLALLRQIPAKAEAAEFLATKFREAGRPLFGEYVDVWPGEERAVQPLQQPSDTSYKLTPEEGRRGFLVGVAVAVGILAVLWWLGML